MFSSFLCICFFYGMCCYGMLCDGGKKKIIQVLHEVTHKQTCLLGISILFFLILVSFWPQQNKFIYFWDYAGYWSSSVMRIDYMLNHDVLDNILSLLFSIDNNDYNIFLPTILALPMNIIGTGFSKYVIICCILFLLPTYFVQAMLATKIVKNLSFNHSSVFVVSFILSVLFAANYYAVFQGYADIAYLLPMSVVLYLLVDYNFSKINTSRNIAIALIFILIWICRRYAVYFLVGYVAALMIKALFYLAKNKKIKNIVLNFTQIGTISLGILFLFFRNFVLRALLSNYGKIYTAYNATVLQKIDSLSSSFGYIIIGIIFISGIVCFMTKQQKENYFALLTMILTEVILFWQTQNMGVHHQMILNVPVFIISLMVLNAYNIEINNKKFIANSMVLLSIFLLIANFSKAFLKYVSFDNSNILFSEKYYPLVRNDMAELNLLANKLNELTKDTSDCIYVAASGNTLNSDILRKIHMPDSLNAVPHMLNTNNIDLRDGFPNHFLSAKYVVTTTPVQLHLPTGQHVVRYLAENINNPKSHLGKHYNLIYQIELQNNIMAEIYEKISQYSEDDLQKIKDYFINLYPDNKEKFDNQIYVEHSRKFK